MAANSALKSAEWKGSRRHNGSPTKLNHGELGEVSSMGLGRVYQLHTNDTIADVLYSQGESIDGAFDGYFCGSRWDFKRGDWVLVSASIDKTPFEPGILVVEETSERSNTATNFSPAKKVRMGVLAARTVRERK